MQTLKQLNAGELAGATQVMIREGLTSFPEKLFDLADTLEVLDLSGNQLSSLPVRFSEFKKLRILFLSQNKFEHLPEVIRLCSELSMVGFKSNQIKTIAEQSLPRKIRWLILTDNQLETLPRSIGQNTLLQKVALAGNCVKALPDEMANCTNLELLRISANQLGQLPEWLLALPKLTWLAFSGNPCCSPQDVDDELQHIHWDELEMACQLGEGASGIISQAYWEDNRDVAVKVFKGEVTSDGYPEDELQVAIAAGQHKNLVTLLATLKQEKLSIENWREKESTRDAVKQRIYDYSYDENTGLPVESYQDDEIEDLTGLLFNHVYRVYPTLPSPVYS